jgi:hypothetical protein
VIRLSELVMTRKTGERISIAERSYEKIESDDLARLGRLAAEDRETFFSRNPEIGRLYRDRVLCVALCQGAALHFLDGKNGIKDFDVWTFFAHSPSHRFPPRRPVMNADFGPSKFGRHSGDDGLAGRRVDFIVRGIDCRPGADPVEVLRRYLTERRSKSARCLSKKAVVMIEPRSLRGQVVWPV